MIRELFTKINRPPSVSSTPLGGSHVTQDVLGRAGSMSLGRSPGDAGERRRGRDLGFRDRLAYLPDRRERSESP